MRLPETFDQLVNTVYDCPNNRIFTTPVTQDAENYSIGGFSAQWSAWEWGATAVMNSLPLDRSNVARIHRLPDSVAMRDLSEFSNLARNMPRGTRA
jgi:hypothetical protein